MQSCPLCARYGIDLFTKEILKLYTIQYFFCPNCQLTFTEKPFWAADRDRLLGENPALAHISPTMTRKMAQELFAIRRLFFPQEQCLLDCSGAYGLLTHELRAHQLECHWDDRHFGLPATNFFVDPSRLASSRKNKNYDGVILGENLAQCYHPLEAFGQIMTSNPRVIFLMLPTYTPPLNENWNFLTTETGQNVTFFSEKTLHYIAQTIGCTLISAGSMHLFIKGPYSRQLINSKFLEWAMRAAPYTSWYWRWRDRSRN